VTLLVKASNVRPIAIEDTYETMEDTVLTMETPGVLGNDGDGDGDPLTVELVSEQFGDYFELRADGSFEYWPPSNYDSPVTFVYRISDGLLAVLITAPTKGTLTLTSNGSFSYIRTPGTRGIDRFTYRVDDSGGAIGNTAIVTIYRETATVER